MTLKDWAREPLVHFLGLGGLLYVALTWGGAPVDPSSRVITADDARKAQLALAYEQVMGRAPTDAELDARIERFVREEVLYREALRLGLDQDDAVVRQRMVAKMDMSASAAAEIAEPHEAELRAYFEANRARYAGDETVSFTQAWFKTEAEAKAALGGDVRGGSISLPGVVGGKPMRDVESQFGAQFTRGLAALEPGEAWQGPIPSGFGWHLVRLHNRNRDAADFAAVRQQVANDWRSAQIAAREERAYAILRDAYRVDIAK